MAAPTPSTVSEVASEVGSVKPTRQETPIVEDEHPSSKDEPHQRERSNSVCTPEKQRPRSSSVGSGRHRPRSNSVGSGRSPRGRPRSNSTGTPDKHRMRSNSVGSGGTQSTVSTLVRSVSEIIHVINVGGYGKIMIFTANIILGLVTSQLVAAFMPHDAHHYWHEAVRLPTTLCLAYIMVNVGYEFYLDKSKIRSYGVDFLVALSAACLPWLFIAAWFIWALPEPLPWRQGLLASCFGAPTSAGILFCMLEAANLKETWLFKKARILAIFDDLDTILLLVPLKALLMGVKWELFLVLFVVLVLVIFAYKRLHEYKIPTTVRWTALYAFLVTLVTELFYYLSKEHLPMEPVHLEVLLPAFTIGAVALAPEEPSTPQHREMDHAAMAAAATAAAEMKRRHEASEAWLSRVSALFMVLVGLSMPPLFGDNGEEHGEESEGMGAGELVGHVIAVSVLMVIGKMSLLFFYRSESNLRTRLALSLGMCPRGEVGAGVIVISLGLGVSGDAASIAIICLALNITMSGLYILGVKKLVTVPLPGGGRKLVIERRHSFLYGWRLRRAASPVRVVEELPAMASV